MPEIYFKSCNVNATIELDGVQLLGYWGKPKTVSIGTHNLKFIKSGYITQTTSIYLGAGFEKVYEITMIEVGDPDAPPAPEEDNETEVDIYSIPSGAKVFFDGLDTGRTTNTTYRRFPTGTHKLTFIKDGYETQDYTKNFIDGDNGKIEVTLIATTTEPDTDPDQDEKMYYVIHVGLVTATIKPFEGASKTYESEIGTVIYPESVAVENIKIAISNEIALAGTSESQGFWATFFKGPDVELIYNVAPVGGAGGLIAGLGTKLKSIGLGAAGMLGLTTWAGAGAAAIKGTLALSSVDVLAVWLASDNVITGIAFTIKKMREAAEAGIVDEAEINAELTRVQGWMDIAAKTVTTSCKVNPVLLPFKGAFLANVEKGQFDFDYEKKLLKEIFRSEGDKQTIKDYKEDIRDYRDRIETLKEEKSKRLKDKRIQRLKDNITNAKLELSAEQKKAIKEKELLEDIALLEYKKDIEEQVAELGNWIESKKDKIEDLK